MFVKITHNSNKSTKLTYLFDLDYLLKSFASDSLTSKSDFGCAKNYRA
jgi:hypothetical protein